MILTLLSIDSPKHAKKFCDFEEIIQERYGTYITQPFATYQNGSWYSGVKPYHASIFPYVTMDMLIHFRGVPCKFFFGHDLLPYSTINQDIFDLDPTVSHELERVMEMQPSDQSSMQFQGFGNRIDTGLNALGLHFTHILSALTKVERDVLTTLRTLQFSKYKDPGETKTFGLQKVVAERLDKSPVAIHKSLRSSKYHLLSETADAMREMMG